MNKFRILGTAVITLAASMVFTSCRDKRSTGWEYAPNMYRHLAYDPDQKNPNFKDGKTAQVPPAGTIPVGFTRFNYPNTVEGMEQASAEVTNPLAVTKQNLADGEALYKSFCSPCHGATGQGDGLVIAHGFPPPPSYSTGQSTRGGAMKDINDGRLYHTITHGYNSMGSYAAQLSPEERWKVVMYVHKLQTL